MELFSISKLILSNERKYRIGQHIVFWAIWWLYINLTNAALPPGYPEMAFFKNPAHSFADSFFVVLAQVPVTYCILYFLLPKFILKKKHLPALLWFMLFGVLSFAVNWYFLAKSVPQLLTFILPTQYWPQTQRTEGISFFVAVMATNKGAFTIGASALMLKFGKHWYHKQHRNLQLQKENSDAQLQLLTAQVHPHFLFNTLNNIYSQTQTESPKGSKMIMSLSDMLRYILYEGRKPMVPLKQELQMITEYIDLEKIRYGNKLDVHVLMTDKVDEIYIAPLLLLPFIENCFKHGTSNMLQNPWINLTVELKDTTLVMKLMNGKAPQNGTFQNKSGIGINNVSQRLNLLYKDKHDLRIREDEEVFVVDLQVELKRIKNKEKDDMSAQPEQTAAYA